MMVYYGDCRHSMRGMILCGVQAQTVVTSPPYWGLRNYGHNGQIGLEKTPDEYVRTMVEVFRLVREILADDGTLWLNLGDSYAAQGGNHAGREDNQSGVGAKRAHLAGNADSGNRTAPNGLKPKDLIGIPWRVAFALQADGWYLRQDIIWHKPNPMPESVTDRCTKAHEYLFLLTKSPRYYFDNDAIKEPASEKTNPRISKKEIERITKARADGANSSVGRINLNPKVHDIDGMVKQNYSYESALALPVEKRNRRSVWTIATASYKEAHFATFPPALVEPCILAGSRPGDLVFDPFFGSGTVGQVAQSLGRKWIGCELQEDYRPLIEKRTAQP